MLYELQGPLVPIVQIVGTPCVRKGLTGLIENPLGGYIFTEVAVDENYL